MNRLLSMLASKKIWIASIASCLLCIGICFAFDGLISKSFAGLSTFRNAESTYVAYDAREFKENCFAYYGKNLTFNVQNEKESIRLSSFSYQFIDNVTYDFRSLLNPSNVVAGQFEVLKKGEMAIPQSLSKHYQKTIGDAFYLNGVDEYRIKFITADFYAVNDASVYSDASSIFVGISEQALGEIESYAVFDNISREYNRVYSLKRIVDSFLAYFLMGTICLGVISAGLVVSNVALYRKDKIQRINESALTGKNSLVVSDAVLMNLFTLVLPFVLPIGLFLGLGNYWIGGIVGGVALLFFATDSLLLMKKAR